LHCILHAIKKGAAGAGCTCAGGHFDLKMAAPCDGLPANLLKNFAGMQCMAALKFLCAKALPAPCPALWV
jgi:hypothetical protein